MTTRGGTVDTINDSLVIDNLAGGYGNRIAVLDSVKERTDLLIKESAEIAVENRNDGFGLCSGDWSRG